MAAKLKRLLTRTAFARLNLTLERFMQVVTLDQGADSSPIELRAAVIRATV
jgi:hypothetical protein